MSILPIELRSSDRQPVWFIGHGSPMNALMDNPFTQSLNQLGASIAPPQAVLVVSAHWLTRGGSFVQASPNPETIHDFGGFPQALFDVQYPAPGSPELALETQKLITSTSVGLSNDWGLDHGCWTVIKFLYPNADIPIIEMSIDYTKPASYHYELGKELAALRPELDGVEVMQRLGVKPGREVGKALNFLMEIRLEEGLLGVDEIGRRLDAWWSEQKN